MFLGSTRLSLLAGIGFLTICGKVACADSPATPDRPGRAAQTDVSSLSDNDLLEQTAKTLDEKPPSQQIDQMILKWGGLRTTLESEGITFAGTFTGDVSKNFHGGLDTAGEASRYLLDMRLNVDSRSLIGYYGGSFSVDFQQQGGRNGSDILTGDVQGFANADADGRTQIAELWYQQLLFEDRIRIKVGKVDANSEFALPAYGGGFVNSSFGHAPTLNPWMPTYPDPSTSFNLFFTPEPWLYASFGVYDGSGAGKGLETGSYGPSKLFHSDRDIFYIGEVGVRWILEEATLPGRALVGGHYSDGDFDRFDGGTQSGAAGFYAILEQKLYHQKFYDKANQNGVYAFLQYGHTDAKVTEVSDYFGAGVTWVGPYEKSDVDTIGLGVAAARLSQAAGAGFGDDFEVSIEAFYNFQVTEYLSVKPDLQYIVNPGGDPAIKNALVATVRLTLAF